MPCWNIAGCFPGRFSLLCSPERGTSGPAALFDGLGSGHLDKARTSYSKAASSYQTRVVSTGKRLEKLTGTQQYKKLLPEGRSETSDES